MKIGVLETGLLRAEFEGRFDPYPIMFGHLLCHGGQEFAVQAYCVLDGEMPASVDVCDGWLITGSRHGVYDELEWMFPLQDFIRDLVDADKPLIGVCFGHQIIAQALGGEVVKSDKGWGVGLHQYQIDQRHGWMENDRQPAIGIYAFHQDQVVRKPDSATVFLSSEFCPIAGLTYGESVLSVQGHPEFPGDYVLALLEIYRGTVVPESVTREALHSMKESQADRAELAGWFANFFEKQQSNS